MFNGHYLHLFRGEITPVKPICFRPFLGSPLYNSITIGSGFTPLGFTNRSKFFWGTVKVRFGNLKHRKINMELKNQPFGKENYLANLHDYVPC